MPVLHSAIVLLQSVLAKFPVKRAGVDAQEFSGLCFVAPGSVVERVKDPRLFNFVEVRGKHCVVLLPAFIGFFGPVGAPEVGRVVFGPYSLFRCHHAKAFDKVLEFPYIARPASVLENLKGLFGKVLLKAPPSDEVVHKESDVVPSLPAG